ncbi:hypothetical protein ACA910_014254 [Epithemia clementina (nom. ined.)]
MSTLIRRRRQAHNSDNENDHIARNESGSGDGKAARAKENHEGVTFPPPTETIQVPNDQSSSSSSFPTNKVYIIPPLTYQFAKWIILRSMGMIYFFAFLGAWHQNLGLMGRYGLVPAEDHWKTVVQNQIPSFSSSPSSSSWRWQGFVHHPSLYWWIPMNDTTLLTVYGCGILLSSIVAFGGINSWFLQFWLWLLYFSVVTSAEGTTFYAYGWESQLLETGFLTIFLCALPHWRRRRPKNDGGWVLFNPCWWESSKTHSRLELEPSFIILWLFRWLCFRISIGAGLIKIRGSSCWAEKTCLHYHFETQPIPSPLSFVYHFLPKAVQSHMVDIDLCVQLYTSFFVLLPTWIPYCSSSSSSSLWITNVCRFLVRLAGWMQSGFMVGIILSGNFAFLNHLTIVPALACLDDSCWSAAWSMLSSPWTLLTRRSGSRARTQEKPMDTEPRSAIATRFFLPRNALDGLLLLYIGYLASPVVSNLLQLSGQHQVMNASFDPFRLVNTYGAFGSVGQQRFEPIVLISDDGDDWVELEFPCKPGSVTRRPCFCAPYHYRLDWNIWFIGFKPHKAYLHRREYWLYKLLEKLLEPNKAKQPRPWLNLLDRSSAAMLESNYYEKGRAPRFARVEMYHYQMAGPLGHILYNQWANGIRNSTIWWNRTFEEALIPPVTLMHGKLGYATGIDSKDRAS